MAGLTPEQKRVVRALKAAPSYKRASPKVRKSLMLAARVESNFSTPDQAHSDRDSEGALQQRPSQGWGPTSETNTQDAEQFLERAIPLAKKYGSAGQLAQAVQRSAFPDRYDEHSALGDRLIGRNSPGGAGGGGRNFKDLPGFSVTTDMPTLTEEFDAIGFDAAEKKTRLAQFLAKRNPHSLLIRAGALSTEAPRREDFTTSVVGTKPETFTVPGMDRQGGTGPGPEGGTGGGLAASAFRRADVIDSKQMPYLWGGGHAKRIIKAADATPLDCSGAVSAVLGINPRVSGEFVKWGRPGDGGNKGVTVYANDGHVLMKINGRFFGTSGSNPGGGAGWIPQSKVSKEYLAGFTARHSAR